MGQNVAQAIVYKQSIGEAMRAAMAATLESLAGRAFAEAIYATGYGFLMLAEYDYEAAGKAFTAAGILGGVGAAYAVAGRAIAPSQKGAGASSGAGTGSTGRAGAGAPTEAANAGGTQVHFYISGPIIGPNGVEQLADMLNDAVKNRDVRLISTPVKYGSPVTA